MRSLISVLRAGLLVAVVAGPASATPNCLRDNKPYKLAGDRID